MPRRTADTIALLLAWAVFIVVVTTAFSLLYIELTNPAQDTGGAADFVGRVVGTLVAALVGYMAGRGTPPPGTTKEDE